MSRRSSRCRSKKRFSRLSQPTRLTRLSSGRRMWFEILEDRILLTSDLGTNLQSVVKGGAANAASLVDAIHDRIFDRVLQNAQPLIGAALQVKDTANDKLNAFSTNVQSFLAPLASQTEVATTDVKSALQNAVHAALGPSATITVTSTIAGSNSEVTFAMHIVGMIIDRDTNFDLGLPGVLSVSSGQIHVGMNFTADLTLGFSTTIGVFLDTSAAQDATLQMNVGLGPNFHLGGNLGILRFTATQATGVATGAAVQFSVGLNDGTGGDNRVPIAQLGSLAASATLSGNVTANLHLVTDLGTAKLPSISTDLLINWGASGSSDVGLAQWGGKPTITFGNVGVDLGSFFNNVVKPVFDQIDNVLAPVQPVIDLLGTRVPVVSELMGHDVTLADFIGLFTNTDFSIVDAVADYDRLSATVSSLASTGTLMLGSFDLGATADPRGLSSLTGITPNVTVGASTPPPEATSFMTSTHASSFGGGFHFPIIETPSTAFDLLLGKDVSIFQLDLPVLSAGFEVTLPTIPILPPLGIRFAGRFDMGVNLGFGYDTSGLRQWSQTNFDANQVDKVFDGFYLRDRVNGVDNPEVFIQARVEATASIDVGIAGVGIGGALTATVGLDLRDPNNDGRVHPSEIAQNLATLGPICAIFEHTGSLDAALTAYARFGVGPFSVEVSTDIISVRLVDFSFPCLPGDEHHLGELDPTTHQLRLFVGPDSVRVDPLLFSPDLNESFIIRKIGVDDVTHLDILQVEAYGIREVFTGVSSIVGNTGGGNDIIQISRTVTASVNLQGGDGNDRLIGGGGGGIIDGGNGDDELGGYAGIFTITGGAGNDLIHGGAQNDILSGGDGDDIIFGGTGNDNISGGTGKDLIHGEDGDDTLNGDEDDDDVRGDNGNDTISGNGGNDILRGGEGDNILYGGDGNDLISAFGGADHAYGQDGNDEIHTGDGSDYIEGGIGNDLIFGEGGDDNILGQQGTDEIHGDAGNDIVSGGTENDNIFGGDGNDVLHGDAGDDQMSGDAGADDVYGDAGVDTLHGGTERDRIWGGTENDMIYGDEDSDALYGEQGNDALLGGNGDDLLYGGVGNDTLYGEAGSDRLYGGDGDDNLYGYALVATTDDNSTDYLYGEAGIDTAFGNGGDDIVDGGAGVDNLYGGTGNDSIIAGIGIGDHLYGEDGNDTITGSDEGSDTDPNFLDGVYFGDWIDGGAGVDTIYGLGGADYIQGGDGNDWVDSGFGNDYVRGGTGNDYLYAGRGLGERIDGEDGDDTIYGSDEGTDTLSGGSGQDAIYGQAGNDTIIGDDGDDHLDGGIGVDVISGGLGNDTLYGGGGVGDQLSGDAGDDTLHGSDDGADIVLGGDGRDTIYGHGGNDSLAGGNDDDIIDGGAGDDTISGDAGSDVLMGGANNDVLYGHSVSGTGDDKAVDYIYGDFGTDRNEAGSGGDRIFGQGGNDLVWGEGGDDFIDVGAGTSNQFSYGAGESATPSDFVTPTPTPPPTVQTAVGITQGAANLPTGVNTLGRWSELAGSGSRDGFSQSTATAIEPSLVVSSTGVTYTTWADSRHGNYEIYVAKYTPGVGWQETPGGAGFSTPAGSASEGGLSNTAGSSRRPSIVLGTDGQPIIAWTEFSGSTSNIRVAKFDPTANAGAGGWVALGTSLGASGISGTGKADSPVLLNTTAGPTVVWQDTSSGTAQVYAKLFSGGAWNGLGGAAFATGAGVSQATGDVGDFAATTDGTKIAVSWSAVVGTGSQIFLREFSAGAWNQLAGSATGNGLSNLTGNNRTSTLAYFGGNLYAAWQGDSQIRPEIFAKRFVAGAWQSIGDPVFGVSATKGSATQPHLAANGGQLHLVWADDAIASRTGTGVAIFATRWNGTTFAPEFPQDASTPGLAPTTVVDSLSLTVDTSGKPYVSWSAPGQHTSQVFTLANTLVESGRVFNASPTTSVQSILDSQDLNPGDIIQLSVGSLAGFTLGVDDSGVTILGVPGTLFTAPIFILNATDVTLQGISTNSAITISGGARNAIVHSSISSVTLAATTDSQLIGNLIQGNGIDVQGTTRATIQRNTIVSTADGIRLRNTTSNNLIIRQNRIVASAAGMTVSFAANGTIVDNDIDGTTSGLDIEAAFTGLIQLNNIHDAAVGVIYGAAASLNRNQIRNNSTGVQANVATTTNGFGFVNPPSGTLVPNEIYSNTVGVALSGVMQWQHIHDNQTGVQGSGNLVAADFDHANVIELNVTGVDTSGSVQFNRIARNTTGVAAHNGQLVAHNLIYRNTTVGIEVNSITDVRIVSNTLHSPVGDLIRVEGGSKEVQITDNIMWAESGFDIYVSDTSQSGFWSDYNLLHASGTGKLVHWSGYDFTDILDWQADVAKYDLHSRGRTVVNPTWSEPRFADMGLDDYRTAYLSGGLRLSNPAIDSGDPLTDLALASAAPNLLVNGSFESSLTGWSTNVVATTTTTPVFDGTRAFNAGAAAAGFAEQTVNLLTAGFTAADLDSRNFVALFGGRIRSASETPADTGQITLKFYSGSDVLISQSVATARNTSDRWELVGGRVQVPVGTRYVVFRFDGTRASGTTCDSFLDNAFVRVQNDRVAVDIGASGNTYLDSPASSQFATLPPHIALRYPDLYTDWERNAPHTIRWETYGNTLHRDVKIDLYQDGPDGPVFVTTIAASTPDDGAFDWTPVNNSIAFGTKGLRIQVQLVGDTIAVDRSTETFAVPENTTEFYVNDRDGSATAGSNRNTGKVPTAPKPFVNNVIRTYAVSPTNTIHVDAGDYAMFNPLVIGNAPGVGDDEGFVMSGPTAAGQTATLRYANPLVDIAPVIELNDADFMSIDHIGTDGGTYGILVHNVSTNFVGSYLSASRAGLDGIRIESTVSGSRLDHVTASANGQYGISIDGPIDQIFDSDVGFNQSTGIYLYGAGGGVTTRLEANKVHDNRGDGILANIGAPLVVGNADLTLGRGNVVRDNSRSGIETVNNSNVTIVGNTVSGQHGFNMAGIYTGGTVTQNIVFDNYYGIDGSGLRTYNRVYNNALIGLTVWGGSTAIGNVVYGNKTGISTNGPGTTLTNNLIYGNSEQGIVLRDGSVVTNNTIYQTQSDGPTVAAAINFGGQASGLQLRNNIIWATIGYGVIVPSNSQGGFTSDYNLLYATGTGKVGMWQDVARSTLGDWQSATFTDQNSLSQNPLFVSVSDFHEQSLYGSFHGGSLAPTLNSTTGLPQPAPGTLTVDTAQSPAIDRGDASDSFANEPTPNGGFINVGAYGNTGQASISPAQYVLVMRPDGGETWPAGQSFPIRWRSHNFTGNVKIELLDSTGALSTVISASTANSGSFTWNIPAAFTPGNYRIRVTRLDAGSVADTSNALFSIPAPVHLYYVNDNTVVAGDWTTAPGNDANNGLTPATPKASIRALLDAYDLGPGDTVRVDAGTYNLTTNILVAPDDSGVKIEGFHTSTLPLGAELFTDDRTLRTVINRGNIASGSYAFQFTGADDVTLSYIGMTGAEWAVVALNGADSDRITIDSCEIYNNYRGGIYFDATNETQHIVGNRIFGSVDGTSTGMYASATSGAVVENNAVYNMYYGTGIDVHTSPSATAPSSILNNVVYYTTYGINAVGNGGNAGITVSGNNVHDNRFDGIDGNDFATIIGNTVHDTQTAISAQVVRNNVVYNSQIGITTNNGLIEGNRVYNNSIVGLATSYGTIRGNTVYSNNLGIRAYGSATITNNLIYDNDNDGIWIYREGGPRIENNTIYQNGPGDAIQLGGSHPEQLIGTGAPTGLTIANNIIHVEQGYAFNVSSDSGTGSTIDYNDLQVTGTGKLASWQNRDFTDRADWFYELGFDQHSQTSDPQLVDFNGADNLLGYDPTPVGSPTIIDNGDPGFSTSGSWDNAAQANGNSQDFVENAFANGSSQSASWRILGSRGYPTSLTLIEPVRFNWPSHHGLGTATYTHTTSGTYTVTTTDGQGHFFNTQYTNNFSDTLFTVDQSTLSTQSTNLSLTFPNVFAYPGFVSVTPISLTTTLRIASAANIMADSATMYSQTVDDGDANFFTEGFNWIHAGRDGDYQVRYNVDTRGTASWQFTGLTPGAYYDLSALWTPLPGNSNVAEFTLFDGNQAVRYMYRDLNAAPNDFTDSQGVKWSRLGVIKVTGDRLTVKLAASTGKLQADAVRLQRIVGDNSADDDFHVAPTSPTVDAGNPSSAFVNEISPNGGRINLGHTGNTAQATTSPAQFVQVLSPNGLEKLEQNQQVSILWRSVGLPVTPLPNVLLNELPLVYYRFDETTGTIASDSSTNGRNGTYNGGVTLGGTGGITDPNNRAATFDGVNDYVSVPSPSSFATSQVSVESWVNPDPTMPLYGTVAMKSSSSSWNDGYGMYWNSGKLRFFVNNYNGTNTYVEATVPTGSWSHVVGTYDGTALKFYINGALVATTAYNLPIVQSAQPVEVGKGAGGNYLWKGGLDELAIYGTALTAGQVQSHYLRASAGLAKVELINATTLDSTLLAAATDNDGDFTWTVPTSLLPGLYKVRVTANAGIQPSDISDTSFVVVSAAQQYYVNDGSLVGDVFATAIGNNANSGKLPSAPMASIAAVLAAYDLDPGDVIHVDAGTYTLLKNIVIGAEDSGVRIEGPGAAGSSSVATLNRGNTATGSAVFQLQGADDVTLDHLNITGSQYGVTLDQYSDSDRLVVTNSDIHDNTSLGIYVGNLNDGARIEDNHFFNNHAGGVYAEGMAGLIVRDNVLNNNNNPGFGGTGITVNSATTGNTSTVSGNDVYGNDLGISANGQVLIEVKNNVVHGNYSGISGSNNVLISQNVAYTNQGYHWSIGYGISATNATVADNVVYNNDRGMDVSGGTVRGNRIYHNRDIGIQGGGNTTVIGNQVYGNNVGITTGSGDKILNNLVYDNANDGIWVKTSGVRVENNTIYQPTTADAIQVGGDHPDLTFGSLAVVSGATIKNNILRVAQGYAIKVGSESEIGLISDYNDFIVAGSGKLGRWEDHDFTTREDWFFELALDQHSMAMDPQFIDIDGPDNKLGYDTANNVDHGLDDNFRVAEGSPTVDAGDPTTAYALEPAPSGGRVNLGHTGNTVNATLSAPQVVQVLSPNGLEKIERGQQTTLQWRTSGIYAPTNYYSDPTLSNTPIAYYRLGESSGTSAADSSGNNRTASYVGGIQLGAVGSIPADTNTSIQFNGTDSYVQLPSGFSNFTGGFTAEMWVYPTAAASFQRMFEFGNGQASDNFGLARVGTSNDLQFFVYSGGSAAGSVTATNVLEFNTWQHFAVAMTAAGAVTIYKNGQVVATGTTTVPRNITRTSNFLGKSNWSGDGLYAGGMDEVAFYDHVVPAQTIRDHYNLIQYGDVKIELERVGGTTQTIAFAAPNTGQYQWLVPTTLADGQYRIRVTANQGSQPTDASDAAFLVTNGGTDFYINDNSTTKDLFTTALGNNFNSGKSPDQPMASLPALLAAYDLDAGDVIHMDSGTYRIYRNAAFTSQDSGVRVEGPSVLPTGQVQQATATIDRGNPLGNQVVVEMAGGDDVTIDYLSLTGGNVGVWAAAGVQSDRLTVSHTSVFSNAAYGIFIGGNNKDARLTANKVYNSVNTGIYSEAVRALISQNEVYGQSVGIDAYYPGSNLVADRQVISNNIVHDNSNIGIRGYQTELITGNTVYGHSATNAMGISAREAETTNNIVYNNYDGIQSSNGKVTGNRVFGNTRIGVYTSGVGNISSNITYSNGIGIQAQSFTGTVSNNLVYSNINQGLLINSSFGNALFVNNTIYQPVGDAIRLQSGTNNIRIRNNIVWVDSGYDINVDAGSQTSISSNYNLLHQSTDPNAHVGLWGGTLGDSLAQWQTASGQDANSIAADPMFVDRDGSDNVLAYRSSDNYDGGRDDNFLLRAGSPAIDRGDGATAPATDAIGAARVDDPGTANGGTPATLAYADLGAYEFQGSTLDVAPPHIIATTPSGIHTSGSSFPVTQLTLTFDEALNFVDAQAIGNYELRSGGQNSTIGDADDVVVPLTATYTPGATTVVLSTTAALPANKFRLTVFGSGGHGLHDLAGNLIDGDNASGAGGDYVRNFTIINFPRGDYNHDGAVSSLDYTFMRANFGVTSGIGLNADGNANGVVDAADYVLWRKSAPAAGAGTAASTAITNSATTIISSQREVQPSESVATNAIVSPVEDQPIKASAPVHELAFKLLMVETRSPFAQALTKSSEPFDTNKAFATRIRRLADDLVLAVLDHDSADLSLESAVDVPNVVANNISMDEDSENDSCGAADVDSALEELFSVV
jgi:parallel beta-helix repeat protein